MPSFHGFGRRVNALWAADLDGGPPHAVRRYEILCRVVANVDKVRTRHADFLLHRLEGCRVRFRVVSAAQCMGVDDVLEPLLDAERANFGLLHTNGTIGNETERSERAITLQDRVDVVIQGETCWRMRAICNRCPS